MLNLRPYQREAVDSITAYFEENAGNPLVVIPTAGGKSLVIATFVQEALEAWPDTRILILTHVKELIAQNHAELMGHWPQAPAGIYSAGLKRREIKSQILFAGIQSIHRRACDLQKVDLVLVDEAHLIPRSADTMYGRFLSQLREINPYIKIIGFTATPFRLDSGMLHEGEDAVFSDIAYDANIVTLIDQGFLCPPTSVSATAQIDTRGVGTRGGEFIAAALEAKATEPAVVEGVVKEIVQHGADRRGWLVFGVGKLHGDMLLAELQSYGIRAAAIYGDTPNEERDRLIQEFKDQKLRALVSVGVLTTGFNARHVDLVAVVRPTKSTGLWIQIVGRGTRLFPGKTDCLVLDFGGNIRRHGPIDRPVVRKQGGDGSGEAPMKLCPSCGEENFIQALICVGCGHEFEPPERMVETAASDLPLLSGLAPPKDEWLSVEDVRYAIHKKDGKPPSLRVTYECGFQRHSEWVCLEHDGYARTKAIRWWQNRAPGIAVPDTVEQAMEEVERLRTPTEIKVRPEGKYTRIVGAKL